MRALPVAILLALALAGCAQAPPPTDKKDDAPPGPTPPSEPQPDPRRNLQYGPWQREQGWSFRVSPPVLAGLPGEEIPFTVHVRHDGPVPPHAYLQPRSHFAHLDGTPVRTVALATNDTYASGRILAGSETDLVMQVVIQYPGGGARYEHFFGPPLVTPANATATVTPVLTTSIDWPAERGLHARVENGRANVTFAVGAEDGCYRLQPANEFQMVEKEGQRELVGFVNFFPDYACVDPSGTPPVIVNALTPELPPGDLRIRVYASAWCACPPFIHERTLRVS